MKHWYVPGLAASTLLTSAWSVSADWSVSPEGADPIPTATQSVSHVDLLNWLADGERGLWVQADNSRWFYARFANVCAGLRSSNSLVFETGASNRIDRANSVIVSGQRRCGVLDVVPSSRPPKDYRARPRSQ
jgi:hypothetical protein